MAATIWIILLISSVAPLPTLEAIRETCFNVEGYLAPVLTPVDDDSALCTEYVPAYAQFLKDNKVNGVIVAATTGEGMTLNVSDNKRLLAAWMEAAPPLGLYVVSSVGGVPLPDTQEMARYSEEIGVDALMALPEVYYKPETAEELVYNMELIAKAAPNTPLIYDDFPQYTRVYVDMAEFYELATERIPTFRGVKTDVFENLLLLGSKISGEQKLYAANSFYLIPEVLTGFKNFVLDDLNVFPRLVIDIIKTGQSRKKGSRTEAISLNRQLVDLNDVINEEACSRIAGLKAAMPFVTGIDVGPVRPPLTRLSEDQKYKIREGLRENNVETVQ